MDSAFERVLMEGAQFMRRFAAMARTPRCSSDHGSTMTTSAPSSRAGEEGDDDEYGEGDGSNAPRFPRRKKAWQEWRVRGRDGRSAIAHVDEVRGEVLPRQLDRSKTLDALEVPLIRGSAHPTF